MSDPTTLPGSGALAIWIRADRGITLAPEMFRTTNLSATTCTLSGNLAQALPIYIIVRNPGGIGVGDFYWSTDSGATANGPVTLQASNALGSTGITATFSGALATGETWMATVASVVSQDANHWLFVTDSGNRPILDYSRSGGQLAFKCSSSGTPLHCSTAGVTAWVAGNDKAFSVYSVSHGVANVGGGLTIWNAQDPVGPAKFYLQIDANVGQWVPWKFGDAGDNKLAGSGAGTMTVSALQIVESYTDGSLFYLRENGVQKMSNVDTNVSVANGISEFVLGQHAGTGSNLSGYINEIIVYTGNQHSVNSAEITAYLQGRYADLVSTAIPDAKFWNSGRFDPGVAPPTWIPNDYKITDTSARLVATGSGTLTVRAIPNQAQGACRSVSVWQDHAHAVELSYSGALGVATELTYNPGDGLTHTIELENNAAIVGISGSYALQDPTAPAISVVCWGDSITNGEPGPTQRINTWANKLRHALDQAQYGTTIWGIGGIRLWDYAHTPQLVADTTTKLLTRSNGTAKRLLVYRLGGNDYATNESDSFLANLRAIVASLHAADPALLILMIGPIRAPGDDVPNLDGDILADIDTRIQTVAAENPAFCSYLSHWTLLTAAPTWSDYYGDQVHPNDSGHAKMAASIIPAVQALVPSVPGNGGGSHLLTIRRSYDVTRRPPTYLWD